MDYPRDVVVHNLTDLYEIGNSNKKKDKLKEYISNKIKKDEKVIIYICFLRIARRYNGSDLMY